MYYILRATQYKPNICNVLFPIMFPGSPLLSVLLASPKHSTSVPSIAGAAVPLSVDEKVGPLVPNPVPDIAVKVLAPGLQIMKEIVLCIRGHSLLPFTLQVVSPLMFPTTVQLKVKVSSGQVGGAAIICPVTSSIEKVNTVTMYSTIHRGAMKKHYSLLKVRTVPQSCANLEGCDANNNVHIFDIRMCNCSDLSFKVLYISTISSPLLINCMVQATRKVEQESLQTHSRITSRKLK